MSDFKGTFNVYNNGVEKVTPQYSGLLGIMINGQRVINHPTRIGYVYVRLRDNLSEVVQVFNDKISTIYDFPVLIERNGNKWVIVGKDTNRYENWGTSVTTPFLPAHGAQHSLNRAGLVGADPVWVYPDQFMPLLVYPSGSAVGSGNFLVSSYVLYRNNEFKYVGGTGTQSLLPYVPTNNQAIAGLVYLDTNTGNPGLLVSSGTPFDPNFTTIQSILPYLPTLLSNQEPLYAFRLVSGTTSVGWENLYNVRQLVGGGGNATTNTDRIFLYMGA